MKYIYIYILFFMFGICFSQVRFNINEPISIDTTQDPGINVIQTKTHHYLSCGVSTFSLKNYYAAYLVKTDSMGNCIWKKQYDFSPATTFTNNGTDMFRGIIELPDSNYLLLGITTNTNTNDDDAFLAKIDTGGNIIWFKKYMHPDDDEVMDFKLTSDGKIIIVGYTFNSGSTDDILLIKTDINGDLLWRKRFGNNYQELYFSIDVVKNNSEYILGGNYGYYDGTGDPYFDFSLLRTDTAGNVLWQQQYGLPNINDGTNGGIVTLDSGYIFAGTLNNYATVLKLDKNGNVQWTKTYSTVQNSYITHIVQLQDSSYAMITSDIDFDNINKTGFLIKADKNGDMLWRRIYPHIATNPNTSNYFNNFNTTTDGGFIITGEYGHVGQPYQNMWLVKTDSLGCDSVSGCSYLPTGVEEGSLKSEDGSGFSIYPNPVNDVLSVDISTSLDVTELMNNAATPPSTSLRMTRLSVTLTNALGVVVINELVSTKYFTVKTQNLDNGIYFVQLYANTKLMATKKVVVQR